MIGNQDNHKLSEELSRAFFRQIISGIGHLHNKKIIHRDIKLENIFLDKSQTKLAIGDFGLSNLWDPSAKLRTRCGSAEVTPPQRLVHPSLQYAAPEIYDRQSVYTQAVDMWSVGVSLYAM
jgi:serine/threonine protein kinase